MKRVILSIDGMTCSACSNGLEKYLNKQDGVKEARVNLILATASITYEGINKKDIEKYIESAGFKSKGEFKYVDDIQALNNKKKSLIYITLLMIIVMYISMAHMFKLPLYFMLNPNQKPLIYSLTIFFITICFIIYGFDIIKNGFKNLIHKIPNMDSLVMIGVLSTFIYSLYGLINVCIGNTYYIHNLYFEACCMIIYFVKLGRYIENISIGKTRSAISKLALITPKNAVVIRAGKKIEVTIDEINIGDIIICKPGEKIAVDGTVTKGKTYVDEAFITGESKPVLKEKNEKVIAGSVNYNGVIEYKAEKIGRESTISEIIRLVVEATNEKTNMQKIADKISGYFVPFLLAIAAITFVAYIAFGETISMAINTFVTILVVACPCSLGLAVPLVTVVGNGVCASKGVFLKNPHSLELARKINTIVLDKTGTLTYGKLKLFKVFNYSSLEDEKLLKIVSSIESKSSHPISSAFEKENLEEVEDFENIEGIGISGKVNNKKYYLGSKALFQMLNLENKNEEDYKFLTNEGCSIVYIIEENKVMGLIGIKDKIRNNAKEFVSKSKKRNIDIIMLTGDNIKTANMIAQDLGIENVIAEVMPDSKTKEIEKLLDLNKNVIMVGDGINDAPALVKSTIGISVSGGTDIAADSSDLILMNNNLDNILDFIDISKKSFRVIRQNLFWAFFYNVCMILIAMGVLKPFGIMINPMIASVAMTISSITVVLNSLRLKK